MRDKLGEIVRLQHIREAIAFVEEFSSGRQESEMETNAMCRFALIKQLEIIGEAANHLSESTKERMPDVEWWKIKGFRNISVHEYFGIDPVIIWKIVQQDIPVRKAALDAL